MARAGINFNRKNCKGCALCISACPKGLLDFSGDTNDQGYHPVYLKDRDKCNYCGLCAIMCPDIAITVQKEVQV